MEKPYSDGKQTIRRDSGLCTHTARLLGHSHRCPCKSHVVYNNRKQGSPSQWPSFCKQENKSGSFPRTFEIVKNTQLYSASVLGLPLLSLLVTAPNIPTYASLCSPDSSHSSFSCIFGWPFSAWPNYNLRFVHFVICSALRLKFDWGSIERKVCISGTAQINKIITGQPKVYICHLAWFGFAPLWISTQLTYLDFFILLVDLVTNQASPHIFGCSPTNPAGNWFKELQI